MKKELFVNLKLTGTNDRPVNPVVSQDKYFIRDFIEDQRVEVSDEVQESFTIGAAVPTKTITLPITTNKQIVFVETDNPIELKALATDFQEINGLYFTETKGLSTLEFRNSTSVVSKVKLLYLTVV